MSIKNNRSHRSFTTWSFIVAALFVFPALAAGQSNDLDPFAGTYKGTAKMDSGEMDVTLELRIVDNKLAGHALAADKDFKIVSGKVVGGALAITFGPDAPILTLKKSGEKLVGDWVHGTQKGTIELSKFDPTADVISGEWEAIADAQGQAFPFKLTLKLDGEKVTGSSDSELGHSPVSAGSWKDGKLSVLLEGGAGQIALVAIMLDGKLSGDYDFAGQLSGKWVAMRKK
jgi:hypothetical protein